jgi:hypothetical protein
MFDRHLTCHLAGLSVRPIGSESVPAYALPRQTSPVTPPDCEFTTEAQRARRFTEENNQLFLYSVPSVLSVPLW